MLLFAVSYIVLWLVVGACSMLLFELVRYTAEYGRLVRQHEGRWLLRQGDIPPRVELLEVGHSELRNCADFRETTLIFVTEGQLEEASVAVRHLLKRTQGKIVIVCGGAEGGCQALPRQLLLHGRVIAVPTLLDPSGRAALAFRIHSTPASVSLDENGRIGQYGFQRRLRKSMSD